MIRRWVFQVAPSVQTDEEEIMSAMGERETVRKEWVAFFSLPPSPPVHQRPKDIPKLSPKKARGRYI